MDGAQPEPAARPPRRSRPKKIAAAADVPLARVVDPPRFVAPVPDRVEALAFPVEYDGRTYATITLRRPSSGVLGRWFEQLRDVAADPASIRLIPPIFVDETGEPIPDEVLNALDDDDQQRVFAETEPFFPKRLADALELLARD